MTQEQAIPAPDEKLSPADSFKLDLYYWLQALVTGLVVLIFLFTFIGRVIGVEGPSMIPTLHNGDMIVLRSIGYTPQIGDVVVLTKPSFSDKPIVKRIIATEGQTVLIDYEAGTVTVDGEVREEPYLNEPMRERWTTGLTEATVPEGSVFVMGDNRNNSLDSRYEDIGFVDVDYIIGKAVFILFPIQDFGAIH